MTIEEKLSQYESTGFTIEQLRELADARDEGRIYFRPRMIEGVCSGCVYFEADFNSAFGRCTSKRRMKFGCKTFRTRSTPACQRDFKPREPKETGEFEREYTKTLKIPENMI